MRGHSSESGPGESRLAEDFTDCSMRENRQTHGRARAVAGGLFALLSLLLAGGPLAGQILENPVKAPVSVRAKAVNGTIHSSSNTPVVGLSLNGIALTLVGSSDLSSYPANTGTEFTTLDLDREYDLQINSVYVGDVEIYFDLPAGLRLLIDGRPLVTHDYDGGNVSTEGSETLKIVVTSGRPPLRAGEEFSLRSENLFWGVSLGRLSDGKSAGMITIREDQFSGSLYTPASLKYARRASEEIDVVRSGGRLRQIKTGSILADIVVTTHNSEFEIRFYKKGDFIEELSGGLYPIRANTQPFVKHLVKNPDST